jgi:type IV secretory pathway TraG/TraD family ATPase VirD4
MLGDATVRHQRSTLQSSDRLFGGRRSVTPDEVRRRLLNPDEALRLPPDKALLFYTGLPPVLVHRLRYYEHPELVRRSLLPPPSREEIRPLLPPPRNSWAGYLVPRPERRRRAPSGRG